MDDIYIYISSGVLIFNMLYLIIKTIITYKSKITQINEINGKSLEQKMDLTDTMFDIFEQTSVDKVRTILDRNCSVDDISYVDSFELLSKYNELNKRHQLLQYKYVWVDNKSELKDLFKKMIKRNGFHKKIGEDLDHYIDTAFNTLFTESKNNINNHMDSYINLMDTTAGERFNVSDAKLLFRELIVNCIAIEKLNIDEIKRIEKSFNITSKLLEMVRKLLTRS